MRCAARLAAGGGGPLEVCAGCPRVLARWSACPRVAAPVSGGADASSRPGCVLAGSCRTGEGPGVRGAIGTAVVVALPGRGESVRACRTVPHGHSCNGRWPRPSVHPPHSSLKPRLLHEALPGPWPGADTPPGPPACPLHHNCLPVPPRLGRKLLLRHKRDEVTGLEIRLWKRSWSRGQGTAEELYIHREL